MKIEDRRLRAVRIALIAIVFAVAVFARLAYLEHRGFVESDEGAYYRFFSTGMVLRSISHYASGEWARHIYFWLLFFWSHFFPVTPQLLLYHNAILGILTVICVYLLGRKLFGKNAGIFAAAYLAVSFNHIYSVRHMKDFSTTLFWFTLAVLALVLYLEKPKKVRLALAGVSLGMMSGCNPTSYVSAGIIFIFLFILFARNFLLRRHAEPRQGISPALVFSLFYLIPIACIELFYPLSKRFLPFWDVNHQLSYTRSLLSHFLGNRPEAYQTQKEGLVFYLKGFSLDGFLFLFIAFFGTAIILKKLLKERRPVDILILSSTWGNVFIFGLYPNISDYFRNVLPSLVGIALLFGLALSTLSHGITKPLAGRGWAPVIEAGLIIMTLSYGLFYSRVCLKNVSAAQQMHDYIQVDRASMTEPRQSVYFWEHYYFRDPSLNVNTWEEVFRNYLSRRAEYLVLLPPNTNAQDIVESKYIPTRSFAHLSAERTQSEFGLFDLNREREIFKERFNFIQTSKSEYPNSLHLKCHDAAELDRNPELIAARFEIKIDKEANLLLLNGRVLIHALGDLVIVMVGDKDNPYRYYSEMFPPKKSLTSMHTVWRLEKPIPSEVTVSICFTNNLNNFAGRSLGIRDFELSLYSLPEERRNLAAEVRRLIEDEKKIEESKNILSQYANNIPDNALLEMNGKFSVLPQHQGNIPSPWLVYGDGTKIRLAPKKMGQGNILEFSYDSPENWHRIYQEIPGRLFKPNTPYRIRFKAKTNFRNEGEIYVFVQSWAPEWKKFLLNEFFWKPWWCEYEFTFTTLPDSLLTVNLYLGEGKLGKPGGKISFSDIAIEELK